MENCSCGEREREWDLRSARSKGSRIGIREGWGWGGQGRKVGAVDCEVGHCES